MINGKRVIGICLSKVYDEGKSHWLRALYDASRKHGYRIIVFTTCTELYYQDKNDIGEQSIFDIINYDFLDALIVMPESLKNADVLQMLLDNAKKHNLPVISLEKKLEGCISVTYDYTTSFEDIVRHVVEGHKIKSAIFVAGYRGNEFSDDRLDCFTRVLNKNGIDFNAQRDVIYGEFWEMPTVNEMKKFLRSGRPIPDAFICANDAMAIAVCKILKTRGFSVPKDCIVTGFDGLWHGKCHAPQLTTADFDYASTCETIITTLKRIFSGETVASDYVVPYKMVVSQSCGCMKQHDEQIGQRLSELYQRLDDSKEHELFMYTMMREITFCETLGEVRTGLFRFLLNNSCICLNGDFMSPTTRKKNFPFDEIMNVLLRKKDNAIVEYEENFLLSEMIPNLNVSIENSKPIIILPLHFQDDVFGYIAIQNEPIDSEIDKLMGFVFVLDHSLGIFKTQLQLKSANRQLIDKNEQLSFMYVHDYMTGLLNRRGFYFGLSPLLEESKKTQTGLAIISADLDDLKYINDNFSHIEGDNAINIVAEAFKSNATEKMLCARFGGDEFLAALSGENAEESAKNFIAGVYDYVRDYNESSGKEYKIVVSLGMNVGLYDDSTSLDDLIVKADNLMYSEKQRRKQLKKQIDKERTSD